MYTSPVAWLLRGYLALAIVAAVSAPAIVAFLRQGIRTSALGLGVVGAWPLANSAILGHATIGERFGFLGFAAAGWGAVLAGVVLIALLIGRRA